MTSPEAFFDDHGTTEHFKPRGDFNKARPQGGGSSAGSEVIAEPRAGHGKSGDEARITPSPANWRERFTLTLLADITIDDEPLWLIDSLIPAGPSLGVIFGKPKSGKTFLGADMLLHVAMGSPYCGLAVQQGAVVYITKEGIRGFKRRMLAMKQHYNVGSDVPFYIAQEMPNFGANNGDAEALVELIQKLVPQHTPIVAVVIDTLARTMPGQGEDTAAMSQFVENCDIVARAFSCFIAAIHHSPRSDDTRGRGSNVLDGGADIVVSVIKNDATHVSTARVEAVKDSEEGLAWRFHITQIELQDQNQNHGFAPLCETVSEPRREGATETKAKTKLTAEQRRFFDILCEAVLEAGQIAPASNTVPFNIKAVTREYFKKCLLDRGFLDAEKPDSVRALFSKYINNLAGRKVIGTDKTYVWLPKR